MEIKICDSHEEVSVEAKNIVIEEILQKKSLLLCTASGGTPKRMYELIAKEANTNPHLFSQLHVVKLDEWDGIAMSHPGTCEYYLQQNVVRPLHISADRFISFRSDTEEPGKECERVQSQLTQQGPIDICILGLGMNGHIAFNEPASFLQAHCHVASLSDTSLLHPMISSESRKPTNGLTLGMADILQSKKIMIMVSGAKKKMITQELLSAKITTALPASFLWLHPNAVCLIDKEAV